VYKSVNEINNKYHNLQRFTPREGGGESLCGTKRGFAAGGRRVHAEEVVDVATPLPRPRLWCVGEREARRVDDTVIAY